MPESPYPEVPVDEALAAVLAEVEPLAARRVPFEDAVGRVLAEAVFADGPMPPFAASAKDGYAVVAADGVGWREVVGEATAGRAPDVRVRPGTAARITTGAPLPDGADAVVMVEQTEASGDRVTIGRAVAPGADVRPAGQDYEAGALILAAGTPVGPAEVGLLASVGAVEAAVHGRPRVGVFSTGDEVVEPSERPGPGRIRDSNRFTLVAAAREAGAQAENLGILRDAPGELGRLAEAVAAFDVVVTSGGVSMGHLDLVKPWLAEHGRLVFGRVRIKPGKPVTFAVVGRTPVFGLPGFPVSSMVGFELFVRPALRRLLGSADAGRPVWRVRAGHDLEHAPERTEFQRAVVRLEGGAPVARTTGFQGSGRLLSFSGANALLRLPEGTGRTREGEWVDALVLGPVAGGAPA